MTTFTFEVWNDTTKRFEPVRDQSTAYGRPFTFKDTASAYKAAFDYRRKLGHWNVRDFRVVPVDPWRGMV